MFIGFANLYQRFIQVFSRIAALLILMLKTTGSFEELVLRTFKAGNNEVVGGGNDKADETVVDLSKSKNKKSKKLTYVPSIGVTRELN